eukprot:gene6493-354_t
MWTKLQLIIQHEKVDVEIPENFGKKGGKRVAKHESIPRQRKRPRRYCLEEYCQPFGQEVIIFQEDRKRTELKRYEDATWDKQLQEFQRPTIWNEFE